MKRKFREAYNQNEALAINPSALDISFLLGGAKENELIGAVEVVYISGPLEHHDTGMFDSYDSILERIRAACTNEESKAVVLCIDSPGGDAGGATEANRQIRTLREEYDKPIYAYSNEQMYSAAYSIGSAADEIWLPDTGGVGSVGVIAALCDKTKANQKAGLKIELITTGSRKADSQEDRVITDEIKAVIQKRIDHLGKHFFAVVAEGRGMSPDAVKALQAGVFLGKQAVKVGLADGVAGWYSFLSMVGDSIESPIPTQTNSNVVTKETDKEITHMRASILKLTKAKAKALDAFNAAASDSKVTKEDKDKLLASFELAATALAEAKTKYMKKTEERSVTDDDDDDEEEEKEEKEDEDDDDDDSDDDDSSSDASESAAESEAMTELAAKSGLHTAQRLYRMCSQVTGTKDIRKMFGALSGMQVNAKEMEKQSKRLAKLETASRKEKVDAIIQAAVTSGKVTPATVDHLRSMGMNDPKWLKGYLSTLPKIVHTQDDMSVPMLGASAPSLNEMGLNPDQQKILQQAANGAGQSFDEFATKVASRIKSNSSTKF